jgi:hypothetical protein
MTNFTPGAASLPNPVFYVANLSNSALYVANLSNSALYAAAGARIEVAVVMSVDADVEDPRVVIEHLLGPVPVVDGPVHDENSMNS